MEQNSISCRPDAGTILVVGGGVAGLEAARQAAQEGYNVHILTKDACLGGRVETLAQTFPVNRCELSAEEGPANPATVHTCTNPCTCLGRRIQETEAESQITIHEQAVLTDLQGQPGNFLASVKMSNSVITLPAAYVILATGTELYLKTAAGEFGYGIFNNVVTGLDFEQILAGKSPLVTKPGGFAPSSLPGKIAFIQCVGSRDINRGKAYCSAVCCMYSTKEAILAKELNPAAETTIFYHDLRTFGKDDDRYVERARELGVRYQRAMISEVLEDPLDHQMKIKYFAADGLREDQFDLVVLATALEPPQDFVQLAQSIGVETDEYGFVSTDWQHPYRTSRPGVFVAGTARGPRGIPESVLEAQGAVGQIAQLDSREIPGTAKAIPDPDFPPDTAVVILREPHAARSLNVSALEAKIKVQVQVKAVEEVETGPDDLSALNHVFRRYLPGRLVIVKTGLGLSDQALLAQVRQAGGREVLTAIVNCYTRDLASASQIIPQVVSAVNKLRQVKPAHLEPVPVNQKALIIGGGLAGMTAAAELAEHGIKSVILEETPNLGGRFNNLHRTATGQELAAVKKQLLETVESSELIQVVTNARVEALAGGKGNYQLTVSLGEADAKLRTITAVTGGALIVASGAAEQEPGGYLYHEDERVISGAELENRLDSEELDNVKQLVFVQCAGCRVPGGDNTCRRTCCLQTLKNAVAFKQKAPESEVIVLYRDIRAYGLYEQVYLAARDKGVLFVRYDLDQPPKINRREVGILEINLKDPESGVPVTLWPDLLVLANGVNPNPGNRRLARILGLPLDQDGYFLPEHLKWDPLNAPKEGIFLCGTALGPATVEETTAQAVAAAARAKGIINKMSLEAPLNVAQVDQEKCAACLTCVRNCPYGAPRIGAEMKAEIDPLQCRGCGICAAECPAKAIQLVGYEDQGVLSWISGLLTEVQVNG